MRPLLLLLVLCSVACANPPSDVRVAITRDGLQITGLPALSEDGRFVLVQNGPTLLEMAVHSDDVKSWMVQRIEDDEGAVVLSTDSMELGEAVDAIEAHAWQSLSGTLALEAHPREDVFVGRSIRVSAPRLRSMLDESDPDAPDLAPMFEVRIDGRTIQVPQEGEELVGAMLAPDRSFVLLTVWGCACECADWSVIVPIAAP